MKKIADISHYQGAIDWDKARNDLEMVIFRASIGSSDPRQMTREQREELKKRIYQAKAQGKKLPYGS